jgi:hypothetical protein
MDLNIARAKREKAIAQEVANELYALTQPTMDIGGDVTPLLQLHLPHIFGKACERHSLQTEAECQRVFGYVTPALASLNQRFQKLARRVEKNARKAERKAAGARW